MGLASSIKKMREKRKARQEAANKVEEVRKKAAPKKAAPKKAPAKKSSK